MPVDKNKEKEEQAFLEGNSDIYGQVKELECKVEWLRKGLKDIANSRDDMNPLFLKNIAQAILDGEPTTADEFNKDEFSEFLTEVERYAAQNGWNGKSRSTKLL